MLVLGIKLSRFIFLINSSGSHVAQQDLSEDISITP